MTDTITLPRSVVAGALHALDLSQALLESAKSIHQTTVLEEYKSLRAALAQQAEQGWQPISTAPKDGAEVLLGEPDGSITVAYWNEPKVEFTTDGGYDAPWATHWMPLPSAPKGVV